MPALTQHSTSITLFRISAAMFLNYLTIGIPLVMLPLYVQQQLHLSDLLIGIAVGSQFIATLLTRGAAGRKADTSGGRRTVITGRLLRRIRSADAGQSNRSPGSAARMGHTDCWSCAAGHR